MKRGSSNFIAGLDIGSTAIRMAVGQFVDKETGPAELQILGAAESESMGIHKGVVNSIEDVVSSVSAALEKTERIVGVPIDSVWLGISGLHVLSQNSKGVVAVSKADSEISHEDVERALEAARAISTPLNYEVLHVLPKSFGVDGQVGIKDPIGMTGMRLEVDAQIILGSSTHIKNLTKAVYRTGLEIDALVLSILATAEAVTTHKQKELGVVVVNVGGSTTSLAIYEEGDILHTAILPVGSDHVTNDVAIGLRTSIDIAERTKLEFGDCGDGAANKHEEIDLALAGAPEHEMIKRKYLNEIISARVDEIMQKIDVELRKAGRSGLLPAGIIFTGAGSKLPGLVEAAKKSLRLPASLGYPVNIFSVTDKVNDLGFATAVGLVKWGSTMRSHGLASSGGSMINSFKKMNKAGSHLKKWLKALIP